MSNTKKVTVNRKDLITATAALAGYSDKGEEVGQDVSELSNVVQRLRAALGVFSDAGEPVIEEGMVDLDGDAQCYFVKMVIAMNALKALKSQYLYDVQASILDASRAFLKQQDAANLASEHMALITASCGAELCAQLLYAADPEGFGARYGTEELRETFAVLTTTKQ